MGYITIFLVFEKPHLLSRLIEPLFANDFFTPSSLGGLNISSTGRDWLLGGISLEWFLRKHSMYHSNSPINRIEIAAKSDSEEFEYLKGISDQIQMNRRLNWQLSPYEEANHSLQVTSLSGQHLEKLTLSQIDGWKERFPKSDIHIDGTVNFSDGLSIYQELVDQQSFDYWLSQPVLEFTIEPSSPRKENENRMAIAFHSESHIWLRSYSSRVTKNRDIQDADARLRELSKLTEMIVASGQLADKPEVWLKGDAFRVEVDRFSKAFNGLSPHIEIR